MVRSVVQHRVLARCPSPCWGGTGGAGCARTPACSGSGGEACTHKGPGSKRMFMISLRIDIPEVAIIILKAWWGVGERRSEDMENLRDYIGMTKEFLPHQPQQSYLLHDGIINWVLAAYKGAQDLCLVHINHMETGAALNLRSLVPGSSQMSSDLALFRFRPMAATSLSTILRSQSTSSRLLPRVTSCNDKDNDIN